ncbi:saponin hydrolase precursor [Xylaria arbuscula]|nr:saponin hydrolase precursor [Xylaria arbuscula]
MRFSSALQIPLLSAFYVDAGNDHGPGQVKRDGTEPPPAPETIEITELTLPPALWNTTEGACTLEINPSGTGCWYPTSLSGGSFTPDGLHVVATANFTGAPAAPDPASIYTGLQLFLIKADGTTFPNGDAWKCVTCGVPTANKVGATDLTTYAQTFRDGTKALVGTNVVSCGDVLLSSEDCTPDKAFIYPLRFSTTADDDGTGAGAAIRELRLHSDNIHLTFNIFTATAGGVLSQLTFFGRLSFNDTGSRYDIVNATILNSPTLPGPFTIDGDQLTFNRSAIVIGELRGLTGTGDEVVYVGYSWESCNIDLFAAHLSTGAVRRITAHPEYADPISVSPDDQWQVVLDTRGSGRQEFLAAVRGIPPVIDLIVTASVSSVRNNGVRRFFEPYLLDAEGDRGDYFGQKINEAANTSAGGVDDPNWNALADPRWSYDGTKITYYQGLALTPACGGSNPLTCETSPYPDAKAERVMVATLTSREPLPVVDIPEHSDDIPWGLKYTAGMTIPDTSALAIPSGDYILNGLSSGTADVKLVLDPTSSYYESVAVTYYNYSDDGVNYISGSERVAGTPVNATLTLLDWQSNITSTTAAGELVGTKFTSSDGFSMSVDVMYNFFQANGTLVSTVDEVSWYQPCDFC